jgi:hypothetical protein
VAVSSSNSPRFEPNPNTGERHPVPGKTRVATNTLHLSDKQPSRIVLPDFEDAADVRPRVATPKQRRLAPSGTTGTKNGGRP